MQFRKKPVVVEAEQYDGNNNPFGAIKQHQCDYRMCPVCGGDNQPHNYITTMHDGQSVVVVPGDWIIPDGKPETFYPCKPDIFAKTYEPADAAPRLQEAAEWVRPKIVCLCGSTKFKSAFDDANYELTIKRNIVLSVGFFMHDSGNQHGGHIGCTPEQKIVLDELHKRKIDLCDEVFVLNVGGYIGESTRSEIQYAEKIGKPVLYLEPAPPKPNNE